MRTAARASYASRSRLYERISLRSDSASPEEYSQSGERNPSLKIHRDVDSSVESLLHRADPSEDPHRRSESYHLLIIRISRTRYLLSRWRLRTQSWSRIFLSLVPNAYARCALASRLRFGLYRLVCSGRLDTRTRAVSRRHRDMASREIAASSGAISLS